MSPLISIIFITICFLASITVYFHPKTSIYLRLFPIFLFCTLVVELLGFYSFTNGRASLVLYNFFTSFEFLFYMYILRVVIQNKTVKKIIFHAGWLYILVLLVNFIFIQKISAFSAMTYALGCLLITGICIYYFYELFQFSQSVNLTRQPIFWICVGLLLFIAVAFPSSDFTIS